MSSKANILPIVVDHVRTLCDSRTGKVSWTDLLFFYVLPAALVAGIAYCPFVNFSAGVISALIGAMALFGGLLFNLLVLLHSQHRVRHLDTQRVDGEGILRSVFSNVAYAILVSAAALVSLLVVELVDQTVRKWLVYLSAYLAIHFLLVLMMVLKRMHRLLAFEIEGQVGPRADSRAS